MQPPQSLNDTATAPVRRVASAALQAMGLAADLLTEATRTLGADSGAEAIRDAVAAVARRIPQIEDSEGGVADALFVAGEIVHLCDELASRNRLASPAAVGCAQLAEAGAQLALEALTGDRGWTGVQALARRAKQLGEIQERRRRLDAIAATITLNGAEGTSEGRAFLEDLRRMIDAADPDGD